MLQLIEDSGLFDADWYLRAYPDVAAARIEPLRHYMTTGWREGRDPGPHFATSSYLKANQDVAAAGMNPLVHFVEFGQSEGRGPSAHRPPPKRLAPSAALGPAAECVSFDLPDEPPVRWTRAYRLQHRGDLFRPGGKAAGYASAAALRKQLQSAFDLLEQLSGYADGDEAAKAALPKSNETLADAWYVNAVQLRTRWRSDDYPLVVRAFQHDPLCDGEIRLVGEGLAASPIDIVDIHFANPLFPVLVVFAEPDGAIRSARLLAFPSLCRGGLHYSELLYSSADHAEASSPDPLAAGELLASRLIELANGSASPAIGCIEVDIGDADARGPLFQPDVQQWLSKVMNVSVLPVGPSRSRAADYLARTVDVSAGGRRERKGATLRIGHDMVPTVAALVEPAGAGNPDGDSLSVPLLVAAAEPSRPALAIEFPRRDLPAVDALPGSPAARLPRIRTAGIAALPASFPAGAIATGLRTPLSDVSLFVPLAALDGYEKARADVTWIVDASGWPEGGLAQAVHALSLQAGGKEDCISFLGTPDPIAQFAATGRFPGRASSFDDVEAAIGAAQTPLAGFVGCGVLLHDNRTAAVLSALLEAPAVATASCAVLSVKQQAGGGGHPTIADGGHFDTAPGETLRRDQRHSAAAFLWGSHYPVSAPGRYVWLARKPTLTGWTKGGQRRTDELHICSSEVTASHVGSNSPAKVPAFFPRAEGYRTTRVRALFG